MAANLPSVAYANNIWVRSLASEPIYALVSAFSSGGSTDWFRLPSNYDDPSKSRWQRAGTENILFSNEDDSQVGSTSMDYY
jgi:hypothetical protein